MQLTRRQFTAGLAGSLVARSFAQQSKSCPFRLSVVADEISHDFDHACYVASHDFGLNWVELRNIGGKTLTTLSPDELRSAVATLKKYNLGVTDLATLFFKTDFPGAPRSSFSTLAKDASAPSAEASFAKQNELLENIIGLCKSFGTDRIRCFDFWRLDDPLPFRAEINHRLTLAAERCAKDNILLMLENETACNTGTGAEAVATLAAVTNKNFVLNWDLANAVTFTGDTPYPNDYVLLPKGRIGHVHCKDAKRTPGANEPYEWTAVGEGMVDWTGQFRALKRDGYRYGVSLETHWRGVSGATKDESAEASSRVCMHGMKDALTRVGITC